MKRILIFVLPLVLLGCQKSKILHTNNYNFSLEINPTEQSLSASLQLEYIHESSPTDTLTFYLHKNMEIESLICSKLSSWYADTSDIYNLPEAKRIVFVLEQAVQEREMLDINLKYAGKIENNQNWNANQISPYWIELNSSSPWYLFNYEIKSMTYSGVVKIVGDYELISNANISNGNNYFISTETPLDDIVIVASNAHKKIIKERNGYTLSLNYFELNKDIVDSFIDNSLNSLHLFSLWFGDVEVKNYSLVVSPRSRNADYSRMGFYSLSYFNDRNYYVYQDGYLKYISRELARLWWNNSDDPSSWENWLNVSFTEYSAMMILREHGGEADFKRIIMLKAKDLDLYPPLKGIKRSDKYYNNVMLDQSSVILYMLENEIGREGFKDLLRSMHKLKLRQPTN